MLNKLKIASSTSFFTGSGLAARLFRYSVLVVTALVAGFAMVAPFYLARLERPHDGSRVWRLISTHDLPNYIPMMQQFDKVLRSGVVYPRWDPDFNFGYGTATANFYPPGTFYVDSLINAAVHNWTITLFILCTLSLAASGLAFYLLARTFYARPASAAAALLYMTLPFHQMDLYWRGGIPQFVGYAFMPVVLYFAFKLGSEGRLRYYAALGGVHGIYLMSHIPVGYLFTYVLALYAVLWALRDKDPRIAFRIAGGMAISLIVSAIYWLPAAIEGKYAYEWATEIFPYHQAYVSLAPSAEAFTQHIQEVFTYNALALIATIMILRAMPGSTKSYSQDEPSTNEERRIRILESQTRTWIILGVFAPFMSTSFSIHISRLIPRIQIATPPFRWLAIACLFTSLLVAASVDLLIKHRGLGAKQRLAYKLSLGAVILLNLWHTGHGVIPGALANQTFTPSTTFVDGGFTPKGSTLPDRLPETGLVVITPEGGAIEAIRWLPIHREVVVQLDQPSEVRMKTYNFPGWVAHIDGQTVPISSDNDGVQVISVPSGIHKIETDFVNTPPRTAGSFLTGIGALLVLGLSLAGRARQSRGATEEPESAGETESRSVIASTPKSRNRISLKTLGLIAIVVIVVAAIAVMTTRRSGPRDTHSPAAGSTDKPAARGSLSPGSESHLYLPGQDSVIVAVDEKALDQIVTALSGRDTSGLDALVDSGRAMRVPNNTAVRVVEIGTGKTKVKMLEGEHMMIDAWVPERWLR
jgi:6-pyruvoyl-tetrahydropterin synthase-like protein